MNEESYSRCANLIGSHTYIDQGRDARKTHEKQIQWLLQHQKVPEHGWGDDRIKLLLSELSLMDSNNFPGNVGAGEREARIASELVRQRHYGFGHGIGRSGDISAVQPKAAGSSILNQLTNAMILDIIQRSGIRSARRCVLLPVATGMALTLVLLTLRQTRPSARYVVWPRIDQKSCFKSISTAGFEAIVIENVLEGDELRTNVGAIEEAIKEKGVDAIACVLTTTSCFAPRGIDRIQDVAKLCSRYCVPHIINNAYGVQAPRCMNLISEADRIGRVDAFVQSTDKNFLVPVGGAVVASSNSDFIKTISQTYPGRASSTPSIDVFITLLSLGWEGYKKLQSERKENYRVLNAKLGVVAETHGGRILATPNNPISLGVSLTDMIDCEVDWNEFGSMLFIRNVSGARVVAPGTTKTISDHTFTNWGSHSNAYPCAYLTVAAAIGMKVEEIDIFCKRLNKTLLKFKKDNQCKSKESHSSLEEPLIKNEHVS